MRGQGLWQETKTLRAQGLSQSAAPGGRQRPPEEGLRQREGLPIGAKIRHVWDI